MPKEGGNVVITLEPGLPINDRTKKFVPAKDLKSIDPAAQIVQVEKNLFVFDKEGRNVTVQKLGNLQGEEKITVKQEETLQDADRSQFTVTYCEAAAGL